MQRADRARRPRLEGFNGPVGWGRFQDRLGARTPPWITPARQRCPAASALLIRGKRGGCPQTPLLGHEAHAVDVGVCAVPQLRARLLRHIGLRHRCRCGQGGGQNLPAVARLFLLPEKPKISAGGKGVGRVSRSRPATFLAAGVAAASSAHTRARLSDATKARQKPRC